MPVKLRKSKVRTAQIPDEARAIFASAIKLQDIYHDCIRSKENCRSTEVNRHCPDCARYIDLSQELGILLGIKPWETSPLNADSEEPPDWLRNNSTSPNTAQSLGDAVRAGGVTNPMRILRPRM